MNTKHGIFLAMFGLLVFCAFIGSTSAATIYVPDDYANIQLAVNNASAGDTVIVRDGTYTENVFVNKRLTIRSENGSANCAVQAKYSRYHVFRVAAYYVNISGFTVRGATYPNNLAIGGIYLEGSCCCNISGNYISNNNLGIYLRCSSRNLLTTNRVKNNGWGIYSWESHENILGNNTILNSRYDGIYFTDSRRNILKNNNILNNGDKGIQLDSSSGNKIYLNSVTNNTDNIDIDLGSYGTTWNSPSKITYMYKGKNYENYLGNYWDDYTGSDTNGDGIGNTPYSIDSDKDNYPLMEPWENYIAPPPEGLLNVPFFSQRDPAWSDKKLDHSPYSIGEYGCALTSAAMVSKYFGYDTDPDRLNTSLTEVGGLDTSGILHWKKVEEVSDGKVEWVGWGEGSWSRIDQELSEKNPVIANVSCPLGTHFIVFIGKVGDGHYFLDPYDKQKTIRKWPNGAHGEYTLKNLRIYHGTSSITITVYSPVDIVVTDPDGLTISKQLNEIPGATYTEVDINGDGDPDDKIIIPYRKIGNYLISVVPEPDALPTDTYTLEVSVEDDTTITLAEDVQISDIRDQPYMIRSTEEGIIQIIPAMIDFDPDVLTLQSDGKWVTTYIELPEGYDVSTINVSTVMLNDQVQAEMKPTEIGDYDDDSIADLTVKFNSSAVQEILEVGDEVEITVTGELTDGTPFEGSDVIRVIDKS